MVRHTAILLLTLALLIPLTTALSQVQLGSDEQLYVSSTPALIQTDVSFTISPDNSQTYLFYTSSQGQPITRTVSTAEYCTQQRCTITIGVQADEQITVDIQENLAGSQRQTFSKEVQIDSTAPTITDGTINECTEAICAISSQSTVTFIVDDAQSGVDETNTYVQLAGEQFSATCDSQNTCTATITQPASGQVLVMAQDKAGNTAQEVIGQARLDDTPPQIVADDQGSQVRLQTEYLPGEQEITGSLPAQVPLTFVVEVQESEIPEIQLQTSFANVSGTCSRNEDENYDCSVTLTKEENTESSEQATIIISDKAQNTQEIVFNLQIIPSDGSFEPNFWRPQAIAQNPVDPQTWRVLNQRIHTTLHLAEEAPGARPVSVRVGQCTLAGSSGGPGTEVQVLTQPTPNTKSSFVLELTNQGSAIANPDVDILRERKITCEVQTVTQIQNTFLTNTETDMVTIPYQVYRTPPPPAALQRSLNQSRERLQSIEKSANNVRMLMDLGNHLCTPAQKLQQVAQITATTGQGMALFPPTRPAAQGMDTASESMTQAAEGLLDIGGPLCKFVTCDIADSPYEDLTNNAGLGAEQINNLANRAGLGADQASELLNPYKSVVVAAGTLCGPALLYHFETYQSIQCAEQKCILEAENGVTTPGQCVYQARQQECQLLAGNIYYALPATNILDTALAKVQASLANPYALFGWGATAACNGLGVLDARLGCRVITYLPRVQALSTQVNDLKNTFDSMQRFQNQGSEFCSEVITQQPTAQRGNPLRQPEYCTGGVYYSEQASGRYVVVNNEVCKTIDEIEGANPTPQEQAVGYTLQCGSEHIPQDVYDTMMDGYESCVAEDLQNLENLDSYQELITANQEAQQLEEGIKSMETAKLAVQQDLQDLEEGVDESAIEALTAAQEEGFSNGLLLSPEDVAAYIRTGEVPESLPVNQEDVLRYVAQEQREEYRTKKEGLEGNIEKIDGDIDLEERALRDVQKELRKKQREVQLDATQEQVRTTPGFIRRGINSGIVFSQVGQLVGSMVGYDVTNNGFSDFTSQIGDVRSEGERQLASAMCLANDPPSTETAVFTSSGRPIAMFKAQASQIGQSNEYGYIVEYYIQPVHPIDQEARISLPGTVDEQSSHTFSLSQTTKNVGQRAIPLRGPRANTLCIELPVSKNALFGESATGAGNSNTLCTEVQYP